MLMASMMARPTPRPFRARSGFRAPMFWATTVEMPELRLVTGRRITVSTR